MTLSWVGDVYVGAETGLVKSVQLHNQNWFNLGGKPSEAKKENEILRMCWANQDESQVLMGLRSGGVFRGESVGSRIICSVFGKKCLYRYLCLHHYYAIGRPFVITY